MKRLCLATAAASILLVVFFHQGLSGNPMSRLLTVFGLVEDHTLRADRWGSLTYDKSIVDKHVYSDKAPLSSYVVVPFYWVYRLPSSAPQTPADREAANHLAILVAAAVPFAIFVCLILVRVRRSGGSPAAAVWIALLAGFGTLLLNYGNAYFGHMLAGTLLLGSYVLALERRTHLLWAGFLGGCAVLTEYPVLFGVAGILIVVRLERGRVLAYLSGAAPPAIVFFVHNKLVTGGFSTVPYARVSDNWKPMYESFGLSWPNWMAMWELTFSQYRGALFYAPVLFLFIPLLIYRFDGPDRRRALVLILGAVYLAFVSAYFRWDGGWCTGPRHLVPVVMLLLYEGAAAFTRARRFALAFVALSLFGVVINVAFAATEALPGTHLPRPLMELALPAVRDGKINPHNLLTELGWPTRRRYLAIWGALFLAAGFSLAAGARRWLPAQKTVDGP